MNTVKIVTVALVAALAVVVVMGAGLAAAQMVTPWGGMMTGYGWHGGLPAAGHGHGMRGGWSGNGMMGGGPASMQTMHAWMTAAGGMHSLVWSDLAATLNLTPEELQDALADGQTLAAVAAAQGVDEAQLTDSLETAMRAGLAQAVSEGALTQAQADTMLAQMAGRYAWMIEQMAAGHHGAGMLAGTGGCQDLAPAAASGG